MKRIEFRRSCLRPLLLASLVASLGGCGALDALNLRKPTARIAGVQLKDINLTAATLMFDVEVENPYSVPLPLVNLDYGLASGGAKFLSGEAPVQGTVPALGKRTIPLPAKITYSELLGALKGVKLGSVVPYQADLGLSVDAPVAGVMRLPLKKEGELPVPAPPDVRVEEVKWDKLSLDSAGGTVKLHVVNRNQFAMDLSKLAYALNLGDVEVAKSSITKGLHFDADGGAGVVEIPISLSPKSLGLAAFSMLTGKGSGYQFAGDATVSTPFGPMSLPVSKVGQTVFKK